MSILSLIIVLISILFVLVLFFLNRDNRLGREYTASIEAFNKGYTNSYYMGRKLKRFNKDDYDWPEKRKGILSKFEEMEQKSNGKKEEAEKDLNVGLEEDSKNQKTSLSESKTQFNHFYEKKKKILSKIGPYLILLIEFGSIVLFTMDNFRKTMAEEEAFFYSSIIAAIFVVITIIFKKYKDSTEWLPAINYILIGILSLCFILIIYKISQYRTSNADFLADGFFAFCVIVVTALASIFFDHIYLSERSIRRFNKYLHHKISIDNFNKQIDTVKGTKIILENKPCPLLAGSKSWITALTRNKDEIYQYQDWIHVNV